MLAAPAWADALERAARARTTVILGGTDSGKTTLCAFLANGLRRRGQPVLILDADVGQSEIGPPTTLGLGRVTAPIARPADVPAEALWFVGATSPAGCAARIAEGAARLAARASRGDRLLVDTGGLVAGPAGIAHKRAKLAAVRPDLVIALERDGDLGGVLAAGVGAGGPEVLRLPVGAAARTRSARERARHREDAFAAYFASARVAPLSLEPAGNAGAAAVAATPAVDGRVLVGLHDDGGDTIGLGAVEAVSADGWSLSVLTPVPPAQIAGLSAGSGSAVLPVLHEVRS